MCKWLAILFFSMGLGSISGQPCIYELLPTTKTVLDVLDIPSSNERWLLTDSILFRQIQGDSDYIEEQILVDSVPVLLKSLHILSGKIVVLSWYKGVFIREGLLWSRLWQGNGLSADEVFDIEEDENGVWWIATAKGLSRWDGSGFETYTPFLNMPEVHAIAIHKGMVYAGNNSSADPIRMFDGQIWISLPNNTAGVLGNTVNDIIFGADGALYSFSGSSGSPVLNKAYSISAFVNNTWTSLTDQLIGRALVGQSGDRIFVLFDNLLLHLNAGKIDTVRELNCSSFSGKLFSCNSDNSAYASVESFTDDHLVLINLDSHSTSGQIVNEQAFLTVASCGQLFCNTEEHLEDQRIGKFELLSHPSSPLANLAGLWIAGKTDEGWSVSVTDNKALHHDYASGPVGINYDMDYVRTYDRVWIVSRDQIETHEQNFADLNYVVPEVILNWPANVADHQELSEDLAPFSDKNNNGKYEPQYGDAPVIYGDKALYCIFNDHRSLHDHIYGTRSLGLEVHGMIYTYQNSGSLSDSVFFLNYRVINRSEHTIDSLLMSFSVHHSIGSSHDDALGSDSILGMSYYYNLDNLDDSSFGYAPPALGFVQLNNPLRGFIAHEPILGFSMSNRRNPDDLFEYLRYLNVRWPNGNRIRVEGPDGLLGKNNGDGFVSSESGKPTNFLFNDAYNWYQSPYDVPIWVGVNLLSVPKSLDPGESFCLDLALIQKRTDNDASGTEHIKSLFQVKNAAQRLKLKFDMSLGCQENKSNESYSDKFGIYPNPTTGILNLNIPETQFADEVILYNAAGQVLQHEYRIHQIDISHVTSGVYFVAIKSSYHFEVVMVLKD